MSDSDRRPQLNDPSTEVTSPADGPERALLLQFNDATLGAPVDTIENTGDLPVITRVVATNDAHLIGVSSPSGRGVQAPAYSGWERKYAMIGVFNRGEEDLLSPGEQDFSFGVDFAIDQVTIGEGGDDGDNLVARGLYESAAQYKLQVDNGELSCRIAGLRGDVLIRSALRVEPETWYRTRCTRRGDTVTLLAASFSDGHREEWTRDTKTGSIGDVLMAGTVPLAIAGKLDPTGHLFPDTTDQFNGELDRVVYRLLD